MKKKSLFMSLCAGMVLMFILLTDCNAVASSDSLDLNIIPKPVKVELRTGEFVITGETRIVVGSKDDEVFKIASDFTERINSAKYYNIPVIDQNNDNGLKNVICFQFSANEEKYDEEGYSIDISNEKVVIEANKAVGFFYAVQTLYQLLPYQIFSRESVGNLNLKLPCVYVYDKPRFMWRGNMLDPSRHFISKDYIKQNLDYLASLKMNIFHWHLTDDQGWRIEIDSYPKLTEIGAWRVDRNDMPWHGRNEQQSGEMATYGGFYTKEDIKEIIQYASERYIQVVPEIDMPGHSRAAIASYPEISCDEADYKVATGGIMSDNTYCPGKEVTFDFTEKVLIEVMEMFPSKYMHIGGDECSKDKWKTCEHCQKRISDNQLADEHELQSYFIKRVEKIINANGKTMIGWDEILEGGLAPNATVMSWRGTAGGIAAVKAGQDAIMSPGSHCYLDLRQGDPEIEPDYGYGQLLLSTAYSFNPIPEDFTPEEAKHILGVQGNLWGESMQKPYDHNYMLFPRLFAIAEVGWTPTKEKNYKDFIRRIEYYFNRLDAMNVNYAPSMYNVSINPAGSNSSSELLLSLSAQVDHVKIHYTLDGTEPTAVSPLYKEPISIKENSTIKAQSFTKDKPVGIITSKTINIHKAAGKKVKYIIKPSDRYNTSEYCLTDCLRGYTDNNKKQWIGFRGTDMGLVIDLEQTEPVSSLTASFLHSTGSWIFLPLEVIFEVSENGKDFMEVGHFYYTDIANEPGKYLKESSTNFEEMKVRYIRVKANTMKVNPDWHTSKGGENWLFIDEIIVN